MFSSFNIEKPCTYDISSCHKNGICIHVSVDITKKKIQYKNKLIEPNSTVSKTLKRKLDELEREMRQQRHCLIITVLMFAACVMRTFFFSEIFFSYNISDGLSAILNAIIGQWKYISSSIRSFFLFLLIKIYITSDTAI